MGIESRLTVEEYTSLDPLRGIQEEWDALVQREGLGPAHRFGWLATLEETHPDMRILTLLIRRGDQLVGCAPFIQDRERRKGVNVRLLQPLNILHQLRGTQLILAGGAPDILEAVFEHLRSRHNDWNVWFMYFQQSERQAEAFEGMLKRYGYSFRKHAASHSPYLPLEGSWDEALRKMQPRFRTTLRSRARKIREKGKLELRYLNGDPDWREGLEAVQEIERESWKAHSGMPITHPRHWSFYIHYANVAALDSSLRLPVLYLDREPLAYDFAVYWDGVYYLLQTSFKEKWQSDFPGFVLRKMVIEELYRLGAREIDFGGNEDEWKLKWTRSVRSYVFYAVYNRSGKSLYLSAWSQARKLLEAVKKAKKGEAVF